jgi:hypothetical protein
MASNKKPSIYSDRGGIGSANELDEYGVWVKSEPQVLSADGADKSGDLDDSVLSPAEFTSDELSADDALSFDDAVLDVKGASQEGSSAFSDMEFPDDNIEIETSGGPFSLDSNLDDLNITDTDLAVPQEDNSQSDSFEIEDTSFDDFETPSGDTDTESETDVSAAADDNFEIKDDLDLDDFSDLTASEPAQNAAGAVADDFETDDFETDNFTVPTVKAIENNIENVQDDFDSVLNTKENNLSTQLLLKIADELSSIRGELSELKKEFSNIRPAVSAEDDKHDQSGFFSEEDDETIALTGDELSNILGSTDAEVPVQQAPAVEDDDDDEAIALTGDELDNILNSADFTEESGTNETVENDFSLDEEPEELPEETEIAQSDDDIVLDADSVTLDEDVDLSADIASLSEDDDLGSIPAPAEEEDVDLGADLTALGEDEIDNFEVSSEADDLDTGIKALGDDELGSSLAPEEEEDVDLGADLAASGETDDLDIGIKALDDDELGSGLAPEEEENVDLGADLAASGETDDLDIGIKALDDDELGSGLAPEEEEDVDLGADLTAIDEDDDLSSGIKALDDDELGSGLAPEKEEDVDLGADLTVADEDADLSADLTVTDEDADLSMDLASSGDDDLDSGIKALDDDELGSGLAPEEEEDVDLGADLTALGETDELDTGIVALGDDELGSGLAPEDEENVDLGADFAATDEDADLSADLTVTDEDADLSMDLASSGDDDLDSGIKALDDDELGSGLAPEEENISQGGELIDIDTDDLNIDLDPDTLLNEQNEAEEASSLDIDPFAADEELNTEIESAETLDADFSDLDLTEDILNDSEKHDSPELEQLRSEGVTPVTAAPENSSYLENEEDVNSDSLDLSDAVIDEPVLSTDGINDDLEEPSLNDSEFNFDSLDDLTIDGSDVEAKPEEGPVLSDTFDDLDIDIPPEDDFSALEQPADKEDLSPETSAFDTEDTVIPEGFEAEIEEKPIPFDDDLDEDTAFDDSPFEDLSFNEAPAAPPPAPKAAPKKAPPPAPAPQAAALEEVEIPSVPAPKAAPAPQAAVPPLHLGKDAFKIPSALKSELRNILSYMDQLLESLPEEKIEEFAKSTYFDSYKKLFKELGLV